MFIPATGKLDIIQPFEMFLNFYQPSWDRTLATTIDHTVMWN